MRLPLLWSANFFLTKHFTLLDTSLHCVFSWCTSAERGEGGRTGGREGGRCGRGNATHAHTHRLILSYGQCSTTPLRITITPTTPILTPNTHPPPSTTPHPLPHTHHHITRSFIFVPSFRFLAVKDCVFIRIFVYLFIVPRVIIVVTVSLFSAVFHFLSSRLVVWCFVFIIFIHLLVHDF